MAPSVFNLSVLEHFRHFVNLTHFSETLARNAQAQAADPPAPANAKKKAKDLRADDLRQIRNIHSATSLFHAQNYVFTASEAFHELYEAQILH